MGVGQEKGCAATNGRPQQVSARPRRTAKERAIRIIGAGRSPGCLVEKGRGDGVVRAPGPWRARWDQDANNHTKHKTFTHAHHMKTKVGHRKPLTGIPRKRSFSERASVRPQIVHLSALQPSSRFVRRAFCYLCVRYGFRGRFSREFTQTVRPALCPCDSVRARPRHVGPEASAHGLRSFRAPPRSISPVPRLSKRPVAVHTRHRPRAHVRKSEI